MRRIYIYSCLLGSVWLTPGVFAGSLSELNVQSFEGPAAKTTEAGRSPFMPQSVEKSEMTVADLQLTGIAIAQDEAYALVSGLILRVGDRVGGFRVRHIGTDSIILKQLDQSITLKMAGGL